MPLPGSERHERRRRVEGWEPVLGHHLVSAPFLDCAARSDDARIVCRGAITCGPLSARPPDCLPPPGLRSFHLPFDAGRGEHLRLLSPARWRRAPRAPGPVTGRDAALPLARGPRYASHSPRHHLGEERLARKKVPAADAARDLVALSWAAASCAATPSALGLRTVPGSTRVCADLVGSDEP